MQLGLYRTTLAAARLSPVFTVSRLGKMINRGMKSSPEGKTLNSRVDFRDKEKGQPQSWNQSQVAYEEEFPPLSANISSVKSRRRTKIDLHATCERKSDEVQDIGQLQLDASTLISDQNDTGLPTSFGKNHSSSRNPKLHENHHERRGKRTYHEHQEAKRSSISSLGTSVGEPFDICLSETRESNAVISSMNEKNRREWVAKVQSADENDEHKDNMDKSNNIEDSLEETGQALRPADENQKDKDNMEKSNNTKDSLEETGQVLRRGMVLFKHYISLSDQVDIVNRCRELGRGPGGFYRPGYDDGAKLRLYMMCLGLDWDPQTKRYEDRRRHDNAAPPIIPQEFTTLVCRVLDDSHTLIKRELNILNVEDELPAMSPDVCIVNFYSTNGRLGLHQDRDESEDSLRKGLPVVSISLGDSAEFLYGDQRDVDRAERVLLESGDILIFGGESRHIFHGVKTIIPDTAPPALLKNTKLRPGRLNLTFRQY